MNYLILGYAIIGIIGIISYLILMNAKIVKK